MIINKFQGKTEEEATEKARAEMGGSVVIMNVREIKPKGLFRTFKSSTYEVTAAKEILRAVGLRREGAEIVSCPTCGRTEIDLERVLADVTEGLKDCKRSIRVAVMGCVVNGPGEARGADYGVAGGRGCGVLFRRGEIVKKVAESEMASALLEMIARDE